MSDELHADVMPPSALNATERAAWDALIDQTPAYQRAFLTHSFAMACEQAGMRPRVAILHRSGAIKGFFAFQFRSSLHERIGSAVRIGDELCDHATIVSQTDVRITPSQLTALAKLSGLYLTHVPRDTRSLAIESVGTSSGDALGHLIEFPEGAASYFASLERSNRGFAQDTARRASKMRKELGDAVYQSIRQPAIAEAQALIDDKREQYRDTGVPDVFMDSRRIALIDALCKSPDPRCTVHLSRLSTNHGAVAQHLGLVCHSTLNYWFPIYRPDARKYSPGRQLIWQTIQRGGDEGLTLIDRGEGDTAAKREFSTSTQIFYRDAWYGAGVRGSAARILAAAEWRWRVWETTRHGRRLTQVADK